MSSQKKALNETQEISIISDDSYSSDPVEFCVDDDFEEFKPIIIAWLNKDGKAIILEWLRSNFSKEEIIALGESIQETKSKKRKLENYPSSLNQESTSLPDMDTLKKTFQPIPLVFGSNTKCFSHGKVNRNK